jgi:hypothetical protein
VTVSYFARNVIQSAFLRNPSWFVIVVSVLFECKSSEERVVYKKAELNGDVDSENNHGGSSTNICITSGSTFTRRRSAIA